MALDPIGFTKMKMLSGRPGIGDIVPEITYGCVPLRLAPAAGLVNVRVLDELDAMGIQRMSPTRGPQEKQCLLSRFHYWNVIDACLNEILNLWEGFGPESASPLNPKSCRARSPF